jgi:ankyrin repeat protein
MSTEFIEAIKAGDADTVATLLKQSPNIIRETDSAVTPIMLSLYYGQQQIAQMLVQTGVTLTLHEASAVGDLTRVQFLLAENPERLEELSNDGFTILGFAAYFGREALVKWLLEQDAEVNRKSNNPMKVAALHSAVSSQHVGIVRLLLEHGADANLPQEQGICPLHQAAHNGDVEITRLLLEYDADKSLVSENGKSALDWAQDEGHEAVVKLLTV